MRLFKKAEAKRKLSDSEKAELEKRAYDLGFEVGYHKHSELGWVSERYAALESVAKEAGLLELVSENYRKGKETGTKNRERDMKLGLSKKAKEKERHATEALYEMSSQEKDRIHLGSGFTAFQENKEYQHIMLQHPSVTKLPSLTEMSRTVERPQMINGFRLLVPKE